MHVVVMASIPSHAGQGTVNQPILSIVQCTCKLLPAVLITNKLVAAKLVNVSYATSCIWFSEMPALSLDVLWIIQRGIL